MLVRKKLPNRWYAFAVYSRQEKAAAKELERKGYEVYLPITSKRRLWSDRVKHVETALFPGYLFVHTELSAASRKDIIFPKQVWDVVGKKKENSEELAAFVPDYEIISLQKTLASTREYEPTSKLVRGLKVKVVSGPMKGAFAVVEKLDKRYEKIYVQLPLLGRGVKVELKVDDVLAFDELGEPVMDFV